MKFINSASKSEARKQTVEEKFNKLGEVPQSDKEQIFAKVLAIDIGKGRIQKKYMIRTHNNTPYDPIGPDSHRELWLRTELKNVSQETYDYYMLYLKTKNSLYMTRTQRSYING
jgi:hypothetical protein